MNSMPKRFGRPVTWIATFGGVGLFPIAPGTLASLVALFPAWGIVRVAGSVALGIAGVLIFSLGVWAAGAYSRDQGIADPGQVVIDEVAALWLILAFLPLDFAAYLLGFLAFRIFDIVKPWPIGWADRNVSGGIGIMLDDLLAGIYALLVTLAAMRLAATWI